jgi:hypothetical protein
LAFASALGKVSAKVWPFLEDVFGSAMHGRKNAVSKPLLPVCHPGIL